MNTYDLWKVSVQLAEEATSEVERTHHYAVAGVLRGDAVKDYFSHIAAALVEYPEGIDTPDDSQVMEFFRDLDALRTPPKPELDKLTDRALIKGLDALKAMESLNYTGDHTHFEVLADARQVLAAVMTGKPTIPKLERFRCPSTYVRHAGGTETVRCMFQLPHEGNHREGGDGTAATARTSWADEAAVNPPKSYDGPSSECSATGTLGDSPRVAICVRDEGHTGAHCAADGREWV